MSVVGCQLSVVSWRKVGGFFPLSRHFSVYTVVIVLIVVVVKTLTTITTKTLNMKSYKDLQVYQIAFQLAKEVHLLTMKLPKYELFELGSQVRRSAQSVRTNIVEGYGRRRYKQDFVKFLVYAYASLLETISHLEMIKDLYEITETATLTDKYEKLGAKLNNFINYVTTQWLL